jgi:hypothetical protein
MDLRHEVISLLEDSGYRVREAVENLSLLYFEDSSLVGFVSIEADCEELISTWESKQNAFMQSNAQRFKRASLKAWNAYSALLTGASCNKEQQSRLQLIEEDFRGTRKIAVASILTRDDLKRGLYPLLPIQNLISLREGNPIEVLRSRLSLSESQKGAFLGEESAEQFVKRLMDED